MRTVRRLVVIIAVVASSLYAVKHVAAAELDIVITRASCVAGRVVLDFSATNNASMSITASLQPVDPLTITLAPGTTQTGTVPTLASEFKGATFQLPYTREDGTRSTTPVTLPVINCSTSTTHTIYLPLVTR